MTDPALVVASSPQIGSIEPDPELQPVMPKCETLDPAPELKMLPLTMELAPVVGSIGGGVYPVAEKEPNNNQASEEEERPEPPAEEKFVVPVESEPLEHQKEEESVLLKVDEPLLGPGESQTVEDFLTKILKSQEFKAMATLMESAIASASRQLQPMTDKLYDKKYPLLDNLMDKLETASGVKREKLIYGAATFLVVYFLVGSLIQIACNLVGFIYPAWRSIRAVRSSQKDDDTQWLIYWVVFASFSVVDFSILSAIPFYWLAKVVFLLYLYLPTFKGANILYDKYIEPACTVLESYFTPQPKKEN